MAAIYNQNPISIHEYSRIVILGNNGSGKSYLAKKLADITKLPLIHLDLHFFKPGWEFPPEEEWHEKMKKFVSGEKWIIDGIVSFGDTMDMRFRKADLVIFLEVNRIICLWGAIRRQKKKRSDVLPYLDFKYDKAFYNFCKGLWKFQKIRKPKIMAFRDKYPDKPFFVIKGRSMMNSLIKDWNNI